MLRTVFAVLLFLAGLTFQPHVSHAANADHPYANVDHRNDDGNDTGDSLVDTLNDMQLNKNYKGPTYPQGSPPVRQTVPLLMERPYNADD